MSRAIQYYVGYCRSDRVQTHRRQQDSDNTLRTNLRAAPHLNWHDKNHPPPSGQCE